MPGTTYTVDVNGEPRAAINMRLWETPDTPVLAIHLHCPCGEGDCLGIVHAFSFVDDVLVNLDGHEEVPIAVERIGETSIRIVDTAALDTIHAEEADLDWEPQASERSQELLDGMRRDVEFKRWAFAHPTETEEPSEDD